MLSLNIFLRGLKRSKNLSDFLAIFQLKIPLVNKVPIMFAADRFRKRDRLSGEWRESQT